MNPKFVLLDKILFLRGNYVVGRCIFLFFIYTSHYFLLFTFLSKDYSFTQLKLNLSLTNNRQANHLFSPSSHHSQIELTLAREYYRFSDLVNGDAMRYYCPRTHTYLHTPITKITTFLFCALIVRLVSRIASSRTTKLGLGGQKVCVTYVKSGQESHMIRCCWVNLSRENDNANIFCFLLKVNISLVLRLYGRYCVRLKSNIKSMTSIVTYLPFPKNSIYKNNENHINTEEFRSVYSIKHILAISSVYGVGFSCRT